MRPPQKLRANWSHLAILQTLRARLALAAAGSILAAVALFGVVTVVLVNHELRSSLDTALRQRAQDVAQLAVSAPAVLTFPGAMESPGSGRQLVVEVLDARGRLLASSASLGARLLPQDRVVLAARVAGRTGFEDIELGGSRWRMLAAPIAQAGGPAAGGAVLVASDTTDIANTIGDLGVAVAVSGAVVVLLAALAAAGLTRRGLRPLRRLAGAAGEIERTADPARRLPEPGARDEIGQLTGVLNRMLESLAQSRASERRFLADASHELRTPVTALLGNVEYVSKHGADPELLEELRGDAVRLARLVDDLLVLERAAAGAGERELVALDELAREVAAGYDRVAAGALAPAAVLAEPGAIRRALVNLIENGLVHGPEAGEVTVTVQSVQGRALLTISDQGPGPDPALRERVFERFWRGAGATRRPGSGLGLAIVAAIAERHGGAVAIDGSAFTVELPLAPASSQSEAVSVE
ncbi:MAG: HAMP domain-containing histidine kinase [Solirubrobacterales bacterium]|nr:HAMP domain-containing histidine kinase [Solirubrobacterales bacterium]